MNQIKKPIRVGQDVYKEITNDKGRRTKIKYSYSTMEEIINKDHKEWVECAEALPLPYDLVELNIKGSNRIKTGWWGGISWEGLRLADHDEILSWRWRGGDVELNGNTKQENYVSY